MIKLSELIIFLLALALLGIGIYVLFLSKEIRRITNNAEREGPKTSKK